MLKVNYNPSYLSHFFVPNLLFFLSITNLSIGDRTGNLSPEISLLCFFVVVSAGPDPLTWWTGSIRSVQAQFSTKIKIDQVIFAQSDSFAILILWFECLSSAHNRVWFGQKHIFLEILNILKKNRAVLITFLKLSFTPISLTFYL